MTTNDILNLCERLDIVIDYLDEQGRKPMKATVEEAKQLILIVDKEK